MKKVKELLDKATKIVNSHTKYGSANYIIVNPQIADVFNNINKLENRRKKIEKIMRRMK